MPKPSLARLHTPTLLQETSKTGLEAVAELSVDHPVALAHWEVTAASKLLVHASKL